MHTQFSLTVIRQLCCVFLGLLALTACNEKNIKDDVFYFVMPDRFHNGNTDNDTGYIPGDRSDHGLDVTDKAYYHGGDLIGLKQKLPYLKKMGVTAIWMTPVFKNMPVSSDSAAYHGYWTLDYTQVDPHLGTNKQLSKLINHAHKIGLKIFFDIVVNHTADVIRYEECHNPDGSIIDGMDNCLYRDTSEESYTPFLPQGMENIKNPAWLNNPDFYHNRGDSTFSGESSLLGDFFGLDDLKTEDPAVVSGMLEIFKYWIREFQIDGFRLDTTKHVNIEFWQQWTPTIIEYAADQGIDDFFIFGEVFDGNPKIVSQYTTEGKIPSALDFGTHFALKDVIVNDAATSRLAEMFANDDWYNDADSDATTLLTFASNHDIGRIGGEIIRAHPQATDEEHLARLQLAYGLMYFGRGIPVIYYGDEQGFTGDGGDKDAREDMMPSFVDSYNDNNLIGTNNTTRQKNFDHRHPMYRTLLQYKRILNKHKTLRRGHQYARYSSNEPGIFAFSRVDVMEPYEYLVVINTATQTHNVTLPATSNKYRSVYPSGGGLYANSQGEVNIEVPGLTFAIYKSAKTIKGPVLDGISLSLGDGDTVNGRFEIEANIQWQSTHPVPLATVEFEVSVNGGDFVTVGQDHNADYRVFYNANNYENGTQLTLRAKATDQYLNTLMSETVTVEVGNIPGFTVYFKKPDGWGDSINLYYWNADPAPAIDWPGLPAQSLGNGWYSFQFPNGVQAANLIFNDGQGNQTADLFRDGDGCYGENNNDWSDNCDIDASPSVSIQGAGAHWVDKNTIVWDIDSDQATTFKLLSSLSASLKVEDGVLSTSDQTFNLSADAPLSDTVKDKFRHLADWPAFNIDTTEDVVKHVLKGQLIAAAYDRNGNLLKATRVQIPGVLDTLYSYSGNLGVNVDSTGVSASLWAPTAQKVLLKIYDTDLNLIATHTPANTENGRYTFSGNTSWLEQYYRYEITVFHSANDAINTYEVTDPYSVSLSQNSRFSQFIDLANDTELKPVGWDSMIKSLPDHKDISIYEGHLRDVSVNDFAVELEHRGKYLALTYNGKNAKPLSSAMAHLQNLRQAGLTHFHLLPVNDLGSINENPQERVELNDPYSLLCEKTNIPAIEEGCEEFASKSIKEVFTELSEIDPVNSRIQAINYADSQSGFPSLDGFNWGYDPFHFMTPEGSYASDANGKTRILEFRQMVKALHEVGLNVVVDVVFNHTFASGLSDKSVLDKVVPGYYHRQNAYTGSVENSTCCDNTAAEHTMMEHLMVNAVKTWAQQYKIDAFRFDLMGHHPKSSMQKIQVALSALTSTEHGVDGKRIYLYGEGWDFGEVSGNQRFDQATQFNMAGTGVGTFNDRLRDGVRGGNFSDRGRAQGFANGNELYPNGEVGGASSLGDQGDRIRIGLAGNLQDYTFEDNSGVINTGLGYSGVGYNLDPQENVVYIDKHDNETLWDNTQAKLPDALGMDERVRVHVLSQAFVNYAQGIPFHQMGTDLLRSKSLDRDSFDAGDWFNKVDFSLQDNNWAVGLPSDDKNGERWSVISEILSNENIDPQPEHIQLATALFQEQLAIRYSSPLFRLNSAEDVKQRVGFLNTGESHVPGVIAMTISDGQCAGDDLDNRLNGVVVVFNAADTTQSITSEHLVGHSLLLHEIQQSGVDETVKSASFTSATGSLSVPARTVVVFVEYQNGVQTDFPCNEYNGKIIPPGFTVYFEKPQNWSEVSIYYWDTTPATDPVDWPGVVMQELSDNWFSFTFPAGVTAANLIFNDNGAGEQTENLFREGEGCYDINDSQWSATCELPGLALWFKKPANWSDQTYLYYWGAAVGGPEWPGTLMDNRGDSWYFFQMPTGVRQSNLIFNDSGETGTGEQTPDLNRSSNGCYLFDTGWQDTCDNP